MFNIKSIKQEEFQVEHINVLSTESRGINMLFPIIRLKDGDYTHIVGSNSHDTLFIDENTGGIQYLNLQGMEGTRKFNGKSTMEFVPKKMEEWEVYPQIEFVTLEELIRIATENMVQQTDAQIAFHKMIEETMGEYLKVKLECQEKLKDDNMSDSGGRRIF